MHALTGRWVQLLPARQQLVSVSLTHRYQTPDNGPLSLDFDSDLLLESGLVDASLSTGTTAANAGLWRFGGRGYSRTSAALVLLLVPSLSLSLSLLLLLPLVLFLLLPLLLSLLLLLSSFLLLLPLSLPLSRLLLPVNSSLWLSPSLLSSEVSDTDASVDDSDSAKLDGAPKADADLAPKQALLPVKAGWSLLTGGAGGSKDSGEE